MTSYIEEHLDEPIPARLAELAGLSTYNFWGLQSMARHAAHRYLTRQRIEQAKALLAKPALTITEIGLAVGFSESRLVHRRIPQGYRADAHGLSP